MRGDFSSWRDEREQNFSGVLQQQGRVMLDSDWNAQTRIVNDWQDTAGRDIIGAGVCAVPADEPNGLKVVSATVNKGQVELGLLTGRAWADGLLVRLFGQDPVARIATYLQPPLQAPPFDVTTIKPGVRDAVILEVWREEINGFQLPATLVEPALGGPDTTERVHTATALRLFRLKAGDTCDSIIAGLKDDFTKKVKLTVKLQPTVPTSGDCPVVEGGGYTGFEHNLYRIELAQGATGQPPMFKWSQTGGGLVGRGLFHAGANANEKGSVVITANSQAIINSGLNEFYLEAVEYSPAPGGGTGYGHWQVTYGARVVLNSNGELVLPAQATPNMTFFGSVPGSTKPVFFRLWNGLAKVDDFVPAPKMLQDGILLQFEPGADGTYRAGEIQNPDTLINKQPPAGIRYTRVPLGVLDWQSQSITAQQGLIADCRRIFQPLTKLSTCCTFRVGDGLSSHGDFKSIQEAIDHLPAAGGEICVLPGHYEENILVEHRHDITIKGCGARTRIVSRPATGNNPFAAPVIHVRESQNIKLESLAVEAAQYGFGILLEGPPPATVDIGNQKQMQLRSVALKNLHVRAARLSAVAAHTGLFLSITDCQIAMHDEPTSWPAVFFVAEDSVIERNVIRVISKREEAGGAGVVSQLGEENVIPAEAGRGGLLLGGTCARVRVINNLIQGGMGNGITLGSFIKKDDKGTIIDGWHPGGPPEDDPCDPCKDGDTYILVIYAFDKSTLESAGPLTDILIERNRIGYMGLNGIGVAGFFDPSVQAAISVEHLTIIGNDIQHCLRRSLADIPPHMLDHMGYGGISLADASYLVVRDNLIAQNGRSHIEPLCGIFILHGEGIEISRNRILHNGPKTKEPLGAARRGRRGGIQIVHGVAPLALVTTGQQKFVSVAGVPAVVVHENIVSVPVGRALTMSAFGSVSVEDNQFTSRGLVPKEDVQTFAATTVRIINLGISMNLSGLVTSYAWLKSGSLIEHIGGQESDNLLDDLSGALDDLWTEQNPGSGDVLFNGNQCALELQDEPVGVTGPSVLIFTLDDIGFSDNQCQSRIRQGIQTTEAIIFGITLRVSDNHFKEQFFKAALSAVTLGVMNVTTDNEATHCLIARAWPGMLASAHNKVLLSAIDPNACRPLQLIAQNFGRANAVTRVGGVVVDGAGGLKQSASATQTAATFGASEEAIETKPATDEKRA
ncbi:MAG TPA: DUF6519 domain-containing protein [Pyrinomonadaceae bacterium]